MSTRGRDRAGEVAGNGDRAAKRYFFGASTDVSEPYNISRHMPRSGMRIGRPPPSVRSLPARLGHFFRYTDSGDPRRAIGCLASCVFAPRTIDAGARWRVHGAFAGASSGGTAVGRGERAGPFPSSENMRRPESVRATSQEVFLPRAAGRAEPLALRGVIF